MYTCTVKLSKVERPASALPAFTNIPGHWFPPLDAYMRQPGGAWERFPEADFMACFDAVLDEKFVTTELDPRALSVSLNLFEHPRLVLNYSDTCQRVVRWIVNRLKSRRLTVYCFRPYLYNLLFRGLWPSAVGVFDGFIVDAYPQPCKVVDLPTVLSGPGVEAGYDWYVRDIQKAIAVCIGHNRHLVVFGTPQYFHTRRTDGKGVVVYDGDPVPDRVIRVAKAMAEPVGDFCLYGEHATQQGADHYAAALASLAGAPS